MPVALPSRRVAAEALADNDNGANVRTLRRGPAIRDFWAVVRPMVRGGARVDYLAPGVLQIARVAAR
jgi:hypothetical protein